jgi:hypothetical protein
MSWTTGVCEANSIDASQIRRAKRRAVPGEGTLDFRAVCSGPHTFARRPSIWDASARIVNLVVSSFVKVAMAHRGVMTQSARFPP